MAWGVAQQAKVATVTGVKCAVECGTHPLGRRVCSAGFPLPIFCSDHKYISRKGGREWKGSGKRLDCEHLPCGLAEEGGGGVNLRNCYAYGSVCMYV